MTPPGPARSPAPRGRSRRPLLVVAWLVATALGGVIAWSAVTVVAGARGDDGAGVVSQADVAAQLAEATAAAAGPAATGAPPTATDPAPPTASSSPPEPSTDPAATAAGAATPGTATPGAATPGAATPGAATPAAPDVEVARTWDVTGGQVASACAGATIRLLYATPADGWTVVVEGTGPQEVEVRFTRDGSRTRVRAECVAGTPELTRNTTENGGGADGGGDDGGGGGGGGGDDGGGRGDD